MSVLEKNRILQYINSIAWIVALVQFGEVTYILQIGFMNIKTAAVLICQNNTNLPHFGIL